MEIRRTRSALGECLVRRGAVTARDWEEAVRRRPADPEQYLVERGLINEVQLAEAKAEVWGIPFLRIDRDMEIDGAIPPEIARQLRAVPVRVDGDVVIAVPDPEDIAVIDSIRRIAGSVPIAVAPASDVHAALLRLNLPHVEAVPEAVEAQEVAGYSLEQLQEMAAAEPAVRVVNMVLSEAIRQGASDVHIEAHEGAGVVRLRVDGLLRHLMPMPRGLLPGVISRIKILANLDIAEQRVPQDGQFRVRLGARAIDVRTSTVPGMHGECAVLRLLDRGAHVGGLEHLGFLEEDAEIIRRALSRPHGVILVTGPTGSGKSTTLAAMLRTIVRPEIKVLTVEDPVEYEIQGATQVQVNPKAGLTFAAALRAFLRHDPDVIEVGEIRDPETAQIVVRAALTGHLVLTTLHTNDAPGAIPRLVDMGVEPYLVADAIVLVMAQRLVRKTCPACREEAPVPGRLRALFPDAPEVEMRGKGCDECAGRGYRGRTVIAEIVPFDPRLREMTARRAALEEIKAYVRGELRRPTMAEDGLRKVRMGVTTVEEIARVAVEE